MTDRDALFLIFAMLGRGSWHHVEYHEGGKRQWCWLPGPGTPRARGTAGEEFVNTLERLSWEREPLLYAVRRAEHGDTLMAPPSVLWARCETGASERRLAKFSPEPTLVLRDGSTCRRTALWALRRPLSFVDCERANLRLSVALDTPRKHAGMQFQFHPPGTVLRLGRSRPAAVVVAGGSGEAYPAGLVVGDDARRRAGLPKLRDAPDPQEGWLRKIGATA